LIKLLYLKYRHILKIVTVRNTINQGVANSRNIGWRIAKKTFIAFLDSDDTWHPNKLEIQYAFMSKNPKTIFSGHFHASFNEKYLKQIKFENVINVKYSNLLIKNPFITPSVMVRRFVKVRFYRNKRFMEDHLLWIMLGYNSGAVIIPLKLAKIYKRPYGESGLSNNMLAMEKGDLENYLILCKLNYIGPLS
jgi:glycosyltransferase involved in cell wall biosynthesis